MKKIIALVLALVMALSLVACAPAANDGAANNGAADNGAADKGTSMDKEGEVSIDTELNTDESDNKDLKIAFVQTNIHPFFDPMGQALVDVAEDLGIPEVEHIMLTTGMSAEEWAQHIDTLITREYDGIVTVVPSDPASDAKAQEAKDAGIAMAGVAGDSAGVNQIDVFWCTNPYNATTTAITSLIELMGGKGKLLHVTTQADDLNTEWRAKAVADVLAKNPDVELVQTIADVDNTELAQNAVNNFLASGVEIDAILCTGGGCTTGTVAALRQNERKDLKVIGIDTDDVTLAAIRDGYIHGVMYQDAYAQAYFSVLTCYKLANGYKYTGETKTQDSGSALVTLENIDSLEALKQGVRDEILANIDTLFVK